MSAADPPSPTPDPPFEAPHSGFDVAFRLLAAALVAVVAYTAHALWIDNSPAQDRRGAKVHKVEIESDLLKRTLSTRVVVPKGAQGRKNRSMVVFLHGRGESARSYMTDEMFEALAEMRRRAPVMAFPSGGPASYWHDRESGPWASYVLDELIPKLTQRFRVNPNRIAIAGVSMGGYGALNIARSRPGRFCAVAGHSPALWVTAGEAADGAFDDAEDFRRNDVIALAARRPNPFAGTKVWIDAGERDPFIEADKAFEQALREGGLNPTTSYPDRSNWNSRWPEYMGFYVRSLRNCEVDLEPVSGSGPPPRPQHSKPPAGRPRSGSER